MPIIKNSLTPGGAAITYHVAQRIEAQVFNEAQALMVQVVSWPSAEAYSAAKGMSATWSDWYPVSFKAVLTSDKDMNAAIEEALLAVGAPFEGGYYAPLTDDLAGAKARRWANIKMQRTMLATAPLEYQGMMIQADESSVLKLTGAIIGMQVTGGSTKKWRIEDNSMHDMSLTDLVNINAAIDNRTQGLIELSDSLYTQIQNATTIEEVEAVVWPVSGT